jgi:hypothetical protein
MAERPIRALFRGLGGVAWRQATEEERSAVQDSYVKLVEKWKSEGVKFLGSWEGGQLDGFGHYLILEVDDVVKIRRMDEELAREFSKYVTRFSFHVGWSSAMEDPW